MSSTMSTAVASKSKKKSRLAGFLLAGLLLCSSLVLLRGPEPAVERPAPYGPVVVVDPDMADALPQPTETLSAPVIPVEIAYFEVVLLQGGYASKKTAIRELQHIGTEDAVRALALGLGDADARVRRATLEALESIATDDATAAIASLYADRDPRVRADATLALAMTGGASAVEYLRLAIRDPDPLVRRAAVNSLGGIGDDYSVTVIQLALQDPDEEVRLRAIEVIDEINDDAAFRALYPAMPD